MTENRPLVSVVIPAYNAQAFLERAVRSVLAQTYAPVEIIVVDDGSRDDTRRIAESFGEPVRCLSLTQSGPAAARNAGIEQSTGPFVAFLDADDEWLPERLEKTIQPMLENPGIGLCYCRSLVRYEDGSEEPRLTEDIRRRVPWGVYPPPRACTPASTFRRECFDRCGLFDTAMLCREDHDLFIRVGEQFDVLEVPEELVRVYARRDSYSRTKNEDLFIEMSLRMVCKALSRGYSGAAREGALAQAYLAAGVRHHAQLREGRAFHFFCIAFVLKPTWRAFGFLLKVLIPNPLLRWIRRSRASAPGIAKDRS